MHRGPAGEIHSLASLVAHEDLSATLDFNKWWRPSSVRLRAGGLEEITPRPRASC
ncbi:MAG: hypothetical protein ACRECU_08240 [Methylocella sp.]